MTVRAREEDIRGARPVDMAGPWATRAGAFGPCRTMGGDVVAMVYPTPDGRWSWVVNHLGMVTCDGTERDTEAESRKDADTFLAARRVVLN